LIDVNIATVTSAVIIRQNKIWRRKDGTFLYFEGMLTRFPHARASLRGPSFPFFIIGLT
jgi:ribosomal protein L14